MYQSQESEQSEKNLNRLLYKIHSAFDCSGEFQLKQQVNVFYSSNQGEGKLSFPKTDPSEVEKAIKLAKKSGFGKGKENVIDQSYRFAFEFLPNQLGLPSSIIEIVTQQVCSIIGKTLNKNCLIKAELIKLNIYPKGGLFEHHVDSPKGSAFGSLVVFLPSYFEGGDLVIQHNGEQHVHSFGGKKNSSTISWVAFYNDCVHNITEVKEGYRLTLSYNLFYQQSKKVEVNANDEIVRVLNTMQKGKLYGYYCEHFYGNHALKNLKDGQEESLLKGKDFYVLNAIKKLRLQQIQIKVLYKTIDQEEYKYLLTPPNLLEDLRQKYDDFQDNFYRIHCPFKYIMKYQKGVEIKFEDIVWLNTIKSQSSYLYAINGYYGNQFELDQYYCQLIILIQT